MFFKSAISKDAFLRERLAGGDQADQGQEKRMDVHFW